MSKILLVEDDAPLAQVISDTLRAQKYEVDWAQTGNDGWDMLNHYKYDLVVLDWQLPDRSGVQICQEYRNAGGHTPVLVLTGKTALSDKETGLDAGADDYLTKPFEPRELSARIRALLRRTSTFKTDTLTAKDIQLDARARIVSKGGNEVKLLPREFALLHFLMKHPNEVFSSEALLDRVWSNDSDALPNAIRKCVERLRRKLDTEGEVSLIETIHGVGYVLRAP